MSAIASVSKSLSQAPWRLWTSQVWAIMRTEFKKNLWMRRSLWIYLVAFAPTAIIGLHALSSPLGRRCTITQDTDVMAKAFQIFYLRFGMFFGCMGLFTWLFRGEIVEKSLHYYFLAPMRRQVLVVGKFLAGLAASATIFGVSVLLSFIFMYGHFGSAGTAFVFDGPGLGHLAAYLSVTALACVGYGSLFLALSLLIKNPILPGIAVLLWETIHSVMPAMLQKFSMTFYLKQLCPVSIPAEGPLALFTVVAEPVAPWVAVLGLLALSAAVLVFACRQIRRTEISYLAD
jgi:ABC-type transport system involved in multi-copper enzyme maturation permease subunit